MVALCQLQNSDLMNYLHPAILALSSFSHEFCCKLLVCLCLYTLLYYSKFPSRFFWEEGRKDEMNAKLNNIHHSAATRKTCLPVS